MADSDVKAFEFPILVVSCAGQRVRVHYQEFQPIILSDIAPIVHRALSCEDPVIFVAHADRNDFRGPIDVYAYEYSHFTPFIECRLFRDIYGPSADIHKPSIGRGGRLMHSGLEVIDGPFSIRLHRNNHCVLLDVITGFGMMSHPCTSLLSLAARIETS